jgi:hypothetical protein
LRSTGVKWDDFHDVTSSLPGKVILLADTCHSGSIYGSRGRRAAMDMTRLAREFADAGRGVIVFASSQGKEYSLENAQWNHGAFTKSLLDGLGGQADFTNDRVIHQSETGSLRQTRRDRSHRRSATPGNDPPGCGRRFSDRVDRRLAPVIPFQAGFTASRLCGVMTPGKVSVFIESQRITTNHNASQHPVSERVQLSVIDQRQFEKQETFDMLRNSWFTHGWLLFLAMAAAGTSGNLGCRLNIQGQRRQY